MSVNFRDSLFITSIKSISIQKYLFPFILSNIYSVCSIDQIILFKFRVANMQRKVQRRKEAHHT